MATAVEIGEDRKSGKAEKKAKRTKGSTSASPKSEKPPKKTGDVPHDGDTYAWPDPAKPTASFVPKYTRDLRGNANVRRYTFWGVVSTAIVLVTAAIMSTAFAIKASSDRDAAQSDLDSANAAVAVYGPIANYYDGLTSRQTALETELGSDIAYGRLLSSVTGAAPQGVEIGDIEIANGAPCASPDPFTAEPLLGCLTVTGAAPAESSVLAYLTALKSLDPSTDHLVQAYLKSLGSDGGEAGFGFSITINYTPGALSNKWLVDASASTEGTFPGATGQDPAQGQEAQQ